MEKKITKKDMFMKVLEILSTLELEEQDSLVEFIGHEIELIEKKAEKAKSYKRKAKEDTLKTVVMEALGEEYQTISDLVVLVQGEDVTPSKITARLTALVKEGFAVKEEIAVPVSVSDDGKTTKSKKLMGYKLA